MTVSNKELLDNEVTLTMAQTAAILGIHIDTVRNRIRDGSLESVKFGRRVLIPAASVRRLMERG